MYEFFEPHGDLILPSRSEVELFAKSRELQLPEDYTNYLTTLNGVMPKKRLFGTLREPDSLIELDELFVFDVAESKYSLQRNWKISEHHDLFRFHNELGIFMSIGEATGGTAVLVNQVTGGIVFYDSDHFPVDSPSQLLDEFQPVSNSFEAFIVNMISEEEAGDLLKF